MIIIRITIIITLIFTFGCNWNNNFLGSKSNSSTDNNSTNLNPTTPLEIIINKGTINGACNKNQNEFTIDPQICFEIIFNRIPQTFNSSNIILEQPNTSATVSVLPTSEPTKYSAIISGYKTDGSDDGLYSINILANTVVDMYGNNNLAATYTDNNVELTEYAVRIPISIPTAGGSLANDSCQGLNLDAWIKTGVTSLNTFFAGAPGTTPAGILKTGIADNLLNADHLQFRPQTDNYIMRWKGFLEIQIPGVYTFRTRSDAGSRLFINNILIVNNDGVHSVKTITSANTILFSGLHEIELQYFDTTSGEEITTTYNGPDTGGIYISPLSSSFQPLTCPHTNFLDTSTISASWTGTAPFTNELVGLVKNSSQNQHIKVNIDASDLIKINSGNLLDGSQPLTGSTSKFLAAHNGGGLTLSTDFGILSVGPSWTRISRIWKLECTTADDVITIQVPSSSLDSSVNGIIFSSNSSFTSEIKSYLLFNVGAQKAISVRCSDFSSGNQYFTFGRYNL